MNPSQPTTSSQFNVEESDINNSKQSPVLEQSSAAEANNASEECDLVANLREPYFGEHI